MTITSDRRATGHAATSPLAFDQLLRHLVSDAVRSTLREELAALAPDHAAVRNASDVYLSVAKAARVADVAPGTIRAWIRADRLAARRAGRVLRVSRAELERFLAGAPDRRQQAETRARASRLLQGRRPALRRAA